MKTDKLLIFAILLGGCFTTADLFALNNASDLLSVLDYKGGLSENLTANLATPRKLSHFKIQFPTYCKDAEMTNIRVTSGTQEYPATLLEQPSRTYVVNGGTDLEINSIRATINGPDNLNCKIPVYEATLPALTSGWYFPNPRWCDGYAPDQDLFVSVVDWPDSITVTSHNGYSSVCKIISDAKTWGYYCVAPVTGNWMIYSPESSKTFIDKDNTACPKPTYRLRTSVKVSGFRPADPVEVVGAGNLQEGTDVVGHVAAGEKYVVVKVQGTWALLQKPDGIPVTGWILVSNLKSTAL